MVFWNWVGTDGLGIKNNGCDDDDDDGSIKPFLKLLKKTTQQKKPHIVMFEEAQHAELPEDSLTGDQVLEDIRHLLESNFPSIPGIRHRPGGKETSHRCS